MFETGDFKSFAEVPAVKMNTDRLITINILHCYNAEGLLHLSSPEIK